MESNYQIDVGDCRQLMPTWTEQPQLLFADPPFNIGHPYNGYRDRMPWDDYRNFTVEWVSAAVGTGAELLAIHCPDSVAELVIETQCTRPYQRVAWVIWHYRFGQCGRGSWINSKAHCLVYAKDPDQYTWNPDAVEVPSDRASTYGDKRIHETEHGGRRVPFDVWGIPSDGPFWGRVQGNSKERRKGHPNQLPEVYLERLIRAYTNPGDLVADPFVGSGTTPTVAVAMGRRFVGCEISEESAFSASRRVCEGAVRVEADRTLTGERA